MSNEINLYSKFYYLFFLIIFIIHQGCRTETAHKPDSLEEEKILIERVEEFNLAFKECNIEQLETLVTENYLHTNGNSRSIKRDAWLEYLEKRNLEIKRGNLVVNTYDMSEIEIVLYEDMAIVTGKISTSFIKSGEYLKNEYRITNVWVNEDGSWKRAGFHDGKIK